MVRQSFMHSIRFGDGSLGADGRFQGIDTYTDWHLIPSSRPVIAMPGVETKFVTIPGRDGDIDLSEFLRSGRPAYGSRTGSWEFYVEDEYENNADFWTTLQSKLMNTLHGKKFKMVLNEDDPEFYWEGRFTVDSHTPGNGGHSSVSISYALQPFKRRIRKTSEGTLWDNFNFEKDYDYDPIGLSDYTVSATKTFRIWGEGYPFQLEVTGVLGTSSVTFGGETVTVNQGETKNIGHAEYGINVVTIVPTGTAKLQIDWRGGSL